MENSYSALHSRNGKQSGKTLKRDSKHNASRVDIQGTCTDVIGSRKVYVPFSSDRAYKRRVVRKKELVGYNPVPNVLESPIVVMGIQHAAIKDAYGRSTYVHNDKYLPIQASSAKEARRIDKGLGKSTAWRICQQQIDTLSGTIESLQDARIPERYKQAKYRHKRVLVRRYNAAYNVYVPYIIYLPIVKKSAEAVKERYLYGQEIARRNKENMLRNQEKKQRIAEIRAMEATI